jgi:hypothetical protein
MTVSTNALLYYGFTFTEEEYEPPWKKEDDEDHDSDDWLCELLGGPKEPDVEWSEASEVKQQFHEYWDAKKKFIEELPIMIGWHCYIDYPMYFICIRESHHEAYRGYPVQLKDSIVKNLGWDPTLQEYCKKLGIEWQQPQWELAPLWS